MNIYKKRIALILSIAFIIFLTEIGENIFGANIINAKENNDLIEISDENVNYYISKTALDWAKMMEPGLDLSIGDINKMYVPESGEIQYTASFFCGTLPYGYAVLCFSNEEIVVKEGNLNPGKEGIYTSVVGVVNEVVETSRKQLDIERVVVELSPLQYGLAVKEKINKKTNMVIDNYGNKIEDSELFNESTKYPDAGAIFIKKSNWVSSKYRVNESTKVILNKFKKRSALLTQRDAEVFAKKYACGVQTLTQISFMEYMISSYNKANIKKVYDKLWNYAKISETSSSKKNTRKDKVIYGGGTDENAAKGFVKLAKELGYKNTEYKGVQKNPSVAWIKDKLKYNRPILMGYGINVDNKRIGHVISILGYMQAKKVSSGNTWNYLMVYNGWDKTVCYINYSDVDFMDCDASYFWVK